MANFVTNDYKLDITPQGSYPVVYMSQFEDGRQIRFRIVNKGMSYTIPFGVSAFVSGLKSNGGYYEHTCEIDETRKYVTVSVEADMTDVNGRGVANITLTNGDGEKVISAKFITHTQETVSDDGVEVPTEAETVFQQLLNEIRASAAALDIDIARIETTVTEFISDTSAEIDNFEDTTQAGIAAVDARMDTFISTHSGVIPNATKITQSTLYTRASSGIGSYVTLSDDPRNYDYIIIVFGMYFNSTYRSVARAIVSGADLYNTSQSSPFICNSFGMFDNISTSGLEQYYPLRAMQLEMYRYATSGDNVDKAFRAKFTRFDWAGMEDQDAYGEAWEENDCLVGAVYGIKFESASVDKDAELIDIRVSSDGTTYTTAGAAVRALEDKVNDQSVTINGTGLFIGGVVVEEEAQEQETSN